jgi:shikimate kinase
MGSGKSSVGRLLAKEKNSYFLDTDAMIESSEGMSIQKIFDQKGESYFRQLEEKTVEWLNRNANDSVISTGGGMLVHCEGLNEVGKIVYLRLPFSKILERMGPAELEKRPLFKDIKSAESMYSQRDKVYEEKADIIIDADADIQTVLSRLRDAIS